MARDGPASNSFTEPAAMRKLLLLIPLVLCMGCKGTPPNKDAITEISLARTPCFGTCPVDTLTLRGWNGGICRGNARPANRSLQRIVLLRTLPRLSRLLIARGFFDMKADYSEPVTDLPSVIITVKRGGQKKTVKDYGEFGPLDLWAMEKAIEGVARDIEWKKVE